MAQPSDALPYAALALSVLIAVRSWLKDRDGASTSKAKDAANESERLRALEQWKEATVRALGEPAVAVAELRRVERTSGEHDDEIRDLREWKAEVSPVIDWVVEQRSAAHRAPWRDPTKR